jgi:RNA polymerase sigma-70 factor (ECF subfamily)
LKINDDNYLLELRNKNPKALKYIMEKYMRLLYGASLSILGSYGTNEDIEECVQDSFIYCWDNIDSFSEAKGSFKNWLVIICRSKSLNKRKSLSRNSKLIDIDEVDIQSMAQLEADYISKENRQKLITAIKDLKGVDREIFIRKYFFYESSDSICETLNLTRTAFDNRIYRGKKKIKEMLKGYYMEVL